MKNRVGIYTRLSDEDRFKKNILSILNKNKTKHLTQILYYAIIKG